MKFATSGLATKRCLNKIVLHIATELKVRPAQVDAAVARFDDDIQLRELEARLSYLRELQARREVVPTSIGRQLLEVSGLGPKGFEQSAARRAATSAGSCSLDGCPGGGRRDDCRLRRARVVLIL